MLLCSILSKQKVLAFYLRNFTSEIVLLAYKAILKLNTIQKNNKVAIVGLGWLGSALGKSLVKKGVEVTGTTTSEAKLKELSTQFYHVEKLKIEARAIEGDWNKVISNAEVLIINIPPRRVLDIEKIYPNQIQNIISNTPKDLKVIFVSSTSIYGTSDVPFTEKAITKPIKTSGKAVLKAEELLQNYFENNVTILRLSGLIGPDRLPGRFLAGKKNLENPNSPINLIHLEDCIGLIEAILDKGCFGEIFNGCSSLHPLRRPFYEKAADILQLERPSFKVSQSTSSGKIIDNSKSKTVLGYAYVYDNPEQVFN